MILSPRFFLIASFCLANVASMQAGHAPFDRNLSLNPVFAQAARPVPVATPVVPPLDFAGAGVLAAALQTEKSDVPTAVPVDLRQLFEPALRAQPEGLVLPSRPGILSAALSQSRSASPREEIDGDDQEVQLRRIDQYRTGH